MEIVGNVFETTATIDANRQLVLDKPLPVTVPAKVRVIILLQEEVDTDEKEWLRSASTNPAFDFLREPEEDLYTLSDGKSFHG